MGMFRDADKFCPICGKKDISLPWGRHRCSEKFLTSRERGLKAREAVMDCRYYAPTFYGDKLRIGIFV